MRSIPGRFAAATVSTGAVALLLLLWLPSQSVNAEPSADAAHIEHLQSLLVEHDVRYVLHIYRKNSTDCLHGDAERGQ